MLGLRCEVEAGVWGLQKILVLSGSYLYLNKIIFSFGIFYLSFRC